MSYQITEVKLPAGEYWVGDPCYGVPDEKWSEWLEAADFRNQMNLLVADIDGHTVVGVGTMHGDGQYEGTDGNSYGVDAGLIGVVPVEISDYSDDKFSRGPVMFKVKFGHDFTCTWQEEGIINIGHIAIDTDPPEEEETCGNCGYELYDCRCEDEEE